MMGIVLAVDIGTSSLKAAYIDFDGRLLAYSRVVYGSNHEIQGARDSGAQDWERALAKALEELHTRSPGNGINGVCISGNGPTLVPVRRDGETLPPLYWYGEKAVPRQAGEAPSFFLPHAAWFKENAPDEYKRTDFLISSHEWLAAKLGAEILTVLPQAAYEPYYWDDDQCRLFGLEPAKFPPFVKMGSVMGRVSIEAAALFASASGNRLKSGTPIIAGGPDFITALIGTGTLKPGNVCDRAGSSEGINVCAAVPREWEGLRVLPHAKEGLWNIGAILPSSGRLFETYRTTTGQEERPYEELLAELIPSPGNVDLFRTLDFLSQPQNPLPTPLSPLDSGRSVLCAMGFTVRSALRTLRASGFPVKKMIVSGGQGKNSRWNQLKADIAGVSLLVPEISDGELAGNAVLAAAALGAASTFEEAAGRMIRIREVFRPANAAFWEEQYRLAVH